MVPAFVILNGYLDILPTVDALVDSGFQLVLQKDYYRYKDSLEKSIIALEAKEVNKAASLILICWKEPNNIVMFAYK